MSITINCPNYLFLDESLLSPEELEKRRFIAEMRQRAGFLLKELIAHCIFLWLVISISFGSHDTGSYYLNKSQKDLFIDTFSSKVRVQHVFFF